MEVADIHWESRNTLALHVEEAGLLGAFKASLNCLLARGLGRLSGRSTTTCISLALWRLRCCKVVVGIVLRSRDHYFVAASSRRLEKGFVCEFCFHTSHDALDRYLFFAGFVKI